MILDASEFFNRINIKPGNLLSRHPGAEFVLQRSFAGGAIACSPTLPRFATKRLTAGEGVYLIKKDGYETVLPAPVEGLALQRSFAGGAIACSPTLPRFDTKRITAEEGVYLIKKTVCKTVLPAPVEDSSYSDRSP